MKSVIGTIMIFIGLSVIIYNDWLSFLAQEKVLHFAIGLAVFMLIVTVIVLSYVAIKQRGERHDKQD